MAEIEIHKALGWDGKAPRPFEVAVAQAEIDELTTDCDKVLDASDAVS